MVLSKIVRKHGFGALQDLITYWRQLTPYGYSMEDLEEYVETKKAALQKKNQITRIALEQRCKKCGEPMSFNPVNISDKTRTGDDSTFVWICTRCHHEVWTNKPLRSVINSLYRKRRG